MNATNVPSKPVDNDESVQEDISRLESYRNQLNLILRQQELLRLSLSEHHRARETLEGLERLDKASEILAPVGAETFVKVTPLSNEKVLVGVGSDLIVEVDREKGLSLINGRIQNLEKAEKEMGEELLRLDREAQAISRRIEVAMRHEEQDVNPAG